MSKILIIFYSRLGNTRKIAFDISVRIESDIEEIIDYKKRNGIINNIIGILDASIKNKTQIKEINYNLENYDLIILGTPLWACKITPAIRTFLEKYQQNIKKIILFSTTCSSKKLSVKAIKNETYNKTIYYKNFKSSEIGEENYYNELDEFIDYIQNQK